jgi:hypothetical protein
VFKDRKIMIQNKLKTLQTFSADNHRQKSKDLSTCYGFHLFRWVLSEFRPGAAATGLIVGLVVAAPLGGELLKRRPFHIPLPLVTVLFDSDNQFVEAFVTFGGTSEGWAIGPVDDRYVKDTRRERVDHFYRERVNSAYRISTFEANILERVGKKFEQTLTIYEKDLKAGKWDRLLYLDGYFPQFFRSFFYLYCGSHNSMSALPKVTRIADSLYEESTFSPKSDQRVGTWRANPEQVLKLRIATKELIFQMKNWRLRVINIPDIDFRQDRSKDFRESYELFIRLYFNLPPASVIKKRIF